MTCKKCGAELANEAMFCGGCGAPVKHKSTCAKCGAELKDGVRFCENCGAPVKANAAEQPNTSAAAVAQAAQPKTAEVAATPPKAAVAPPESDIISPKSAAAPSEAAIASPEAAVTSPEAVVTTPETVKVQHATAQGVTSGRACSKCGALTEGDAMFCEVCGAPLMQASPAKAAPAVGAYAEVVPATSGSTAIAPIQAAPMQAIPSYAQAGGAPAKKRSKTPLIVAGIAAAVGLTCGAVWYFLLSPTTSLKAVAAMKMQEDRLVSASQLLAAQDYDGAIALYSELTKANPMLTAAYLGLSDAYLGKEDKGNALAALQAGYTATQDEEIKNTQLRLGVMANGGKATVDLEQIDSTSYPTIRLYYRITNEANGEPVYGLTKEDFKLSERIDGSWIDREIKNVIQLETSGGITTTVIADASGSMDGEDKIGLAKQVMKDFTDALNYEKGDVMEVISFDTYVREVHNFSDDQQDIKDSIDTITAGTQTALYDTLYASTTRAAAAGSAKCIIAFTDGGDNQSSTSPNDVIDNANRYSVPIFIIGFGAQGQFDDTFMKQIAEETGGFYRHISDLQELSEIYNAIYTEQKQLYMLEYDTDTTADRLMERGAKLNLQSVTNAMGSNEDTFTPKEVKTDEDNIVVIKKDETDQSDVHRYGNTTGNIANCGYIAQQGDWLYYRNSSDGNSLYKMRIDGTERKKLSNDAVYSIGVLDDTVYYSNAGGGDAIYKVGIDGTGRSLVTSDSAFYLNVVDDWIYYRNSSDGDCLYRIKTDGGNREKLNSISSWNINVIGDEIFYQARLGAARPSWYLYKMNTDGTGNGSLISDNTGVVTVVGDYVYYRNYSDNGKLYRVRKDGSEKRKLNDDMTFYTNITSNYIYYGNVDEDNAFYRVRTDGSERMKISDMPVNFINIAGNQLVFESPVDKRIYVTDEYGTAAYPIS